jgi:peptidoglycan hydrolase CwlO-like protein
MSNNYPKFITKSAIFQVRQRIRQYLLVSLFFLFLPLMIQGSLIDDLNRQIQEAEQKRLELERQAQEYQKIIDTKRGEIRSLKNEIAIFNARIGKLEIEIEMTEDKIDQTELEILRLEYDIDQAEKDILDQKEILGEIIRTIDQYDQTNDLEIILQSTNLSDFFNQIAYIEGLQTKIQQTIEDLRYFKTKLAQDKETEEEKKEELESLKKQLVNQQNSLSNQKTSRQALLNYTRGEEKKYQQMLANIEAQKRSLLGDINHLRQLKAAELARLKELQEKPPQEYWASTNWYYRQDDARWAKTTIGLTESTLANYGCAVSAVAMILTYHGLNITPAQLAKESIYYYDLIVWPKRWGNLRCMNCPPSHTGVDWFRIDRELGAGYPIIVFIRANGRGAGHYVVIHHKTQDGRYVVHDPLFGPNIYLDSTRVYISNLYDTTTSIDQMVIYH